MSNIEIKNLKKSFDGKIDVLKDINLDVNDGELLTLLGPSGCGKSTLLRSIAGFHPIDSGSILIDGKDVTNLSPGKRDLGMVFQAYSLFPNMNVFDNVAYGLKVKGHGRDKIKDEVMNIIEAVGLSGRENAYPNELSGGQQQRVALARALVTRPKVLLLDEPLSAIDPKLRKSLQDEIKNIQKRFGITTIFVTHDQNEAFAISDRVCIMDGGEILQIDRPVDLYTNPKNEFVASFIGNYNILTSDDYQKLIGKSTDKRLALRPELIKIANQQGDDFINIDAKVVEITPLGNMISYVVDANGVILKVDAVFDKGGVYQIGDQISISFKESDLIIL